MLLCSALSLSITLRIMESYSLCDSLSGFISKVSFVLTVRDVSEIWVRAGCRVKEVTCFPWDSPILDAACNTGCTSPVGSYRLLAHLPVNQIRNVR